MRLSGEDTTRDGEGGENPPPYEHKTGRPRKKPYPGQLALRRRVDDTAKSLPESAWKTITWREASKGLLNEAVRFREGAQDH